MSGSRLNLVAVVRQLRRGCSCGGGSETRMAKCGGPGQRSCFGLQCDGSMVTAEAEVMVVVVAVEERWRHDGDRLMVALDGPGR